MDEVEEALFSNPHVRLAEKGHVKGENVFVAYGQTNSGRYLVVFFIRNTTVTKKKAKIDTIPEEFPSYEAAADFWDSHDTTDYPEAFRTVPVVGQFRGRRFEIEIEGDVVAAFAAASSPAGDYTRGLGQQSAAAPTGGCRHAPIGLRLRR